MKTSPSALGNWPWPNNKSWLAQRCGVCRAAEECGKAGEWQQHVWRRSVGESWGLSCQLRDEGRLKLRQLTDLHQLGRAVLVANGLHTKNHQCSFWKYCTSNTYKVHETKNWLGKQSFWIGIKKVQVMVFFAFACENESAMLVWCSDSLRDYQLKACQ